MVVSNTFLQGDALAMLKSLPDECVQMVCTSPPYFGLRAYLPDGHPDKPLEIGLEETPAAYVARLVEVFREVRRVLRSDGVAWVNLGDSYAGSGKGYGCADHGNLGKHANDFLPPPLEMSGLRPKSLIGIPWRVAFALQDDGWILRADCVWHKTNAMPESVKDRPTKAHEYVFLLSKQERYFYDSQAIREPIAEATLSRNQYGRPRNENKYFANGQYHSNENMPSHFKDNTGDNEGRNKRSVWSLPTQSFPGSHFAVMAPKLAETCILAGSRPGDIVLDPFSGAGTTAYVAMQHGRKYLGIELNPTYIEMAEKRLDSIRGLWETIA